MAAPVWHREQYNEVIVISDDDEDDAKVDRKVLDRLLRTPSQNADRRGSAATRNTKRGYQIQNARSPILSEDDEVGDLHDVTLRHRDYSAGSGSARPLPAATPVDELQNHMQTFRGVQLFAPAGLRDNERSLERSYPDRASSAVVNTPGEEISPDDCLQRVLAIFPDVSHEHVRDLYHQHESTVGSQEFPAVSRLEHIVERLVSGEAYPKQERARQLQRKRKRQDGNDGTGTQLWEGPNRLITPAGLLRTMSAMLKAEFPEFARKDIIQMLGECKHLYQTYLKLAEAKDTGHPACGRGRPSQSVKCGAENLAAEQSQHPLLDELNAARKRADELRGERALERARERCEQENLQRAVEVGEIADCTACMDQLATNRQIHCDGKKTHYLCYGCAQTYIGVLVGDAKCEMRCPSGCGASFSHSQLALLADQGLIAKLARLQQEKDIRDAGIDDIGECPFCDFKAIVPPIEVDFEFRCENPECEKVSCRRCNNITHTPRTCKQYADEQKLNSRHAVEEAMTAALVRKCNSCKKPFIKETGCNKMTCPSCGNIQCYVCSLSIPNYDHFKDWPNGTRATGGKAIRGCKLYDNVEERHEREVREAETTARAAVISANPDVSEEDLQIKVSEAVKATTDEPAGRTNERLPGFGIMRLRPNRDMGMFFHYDEIANMNGHAGPGGDGDGQHRAPDVYAQNHDAQWYGLMQVPPWWIDRPHPQPYPPAANHHDRPPNPNMPLPGPSDYFPRHQVPRVQGEPFAARDPFLPGPATNGPNTNYPQPEFLYRGLHTL